MSVRREPLACAEGLKWVANRLGKQALAPLTGTDRKALDGFLHALRLWRAAPDDHVIAALRALVMVMQPSTRHIAKAAIPGMLDWSDEDVIWAAIMAVTVDDLKTTEAGAVYRRGGGGA